jgi:hypothetical protein
MCTSLTEFALLVCLCKYLPDDDNTEVKHVGGTQVTYNYGLSIMQFVEFYNV